MFRLKKAGPKSSDRIYLTHLELLTIFKYCSLMCIPFHTLGYSKKSFQVFISLTKSLYLLNCSKLTAILGKVSLVALCSHNIRHITHWTGPLELEHRNGEELPSLYQDITTPLQ